MVPSPAVLVLILCIIASVLVGTHQMVCKQDYDTTSTCDIAFGVPIIIMLAVACGVSGLAVLAISHDM
jgi:hypothetical protein